jgi:hypothetical protein
MLFADGDHAIRDPQERGVALVDTFRFEGGRLVAPGRDSAGSEKAVNAKQHVLKRRRLSHSQGGSKSTACFSQ